MSDKRKNWTQLLLIFSPISKKEQKSLLGFVDHKIYQVLPYFPS